MITKPIKTEKVVVGSDLIKLLDQYVPDLHEGSILAITSKIVAICEGSIVSKEGIHKDNLVAQYADYYLPASQSKYNVTLTITNGLLIPTAGIDESNTNNLYVLWPQQPFETANQVRSYLKKRFELKQVGVIITDSTTTPLRWGTRGVGLAYSGIVPLHSYIGEPDIFGQPLKMTKANILDGLAMSAVLTMGEGNEQTPLAVIEDVPFVTFVDHDPSQAEIDDLQISPEDDLYGPLLTAVDWQTKKPRVNPAA